MTTELPKPADRMSEVLGEIVAYCREAGYDWSNLSEAEALLAAGASKPTAQVVMDEREAFEYEMRKRCDWGCKNFVRSPFQVDDYEDQSSQDAWEAWQARAILALAAQPSNEFVSLEEARVGLAAQPEQAKGGETVVRFCPDCGRVGDVPDDCRDCCPDGGHARFVPEPFAHRCRELFTLAISALTAASPVAQQPEPDTFQQRVQPWMMACFGEQIAGDTAERNHRFLEEALELVQACGCTSSEAHQLVDYVYGRPIGEPDQEVGGVMVTLAALCLAQKLDMHSAGDRELARIWTKVEAIRAKQAAKPKHSPLPQAVAQQTAQVPEGVEAGASGADRKNDSCR